MVEVITNHNCICQADYPVVWCPKGSAGPVAQKTGAMLDEIYAGREWSVILRRCSRIRSTCSVNMLKSIIIRRYVERSEHITRGR